MAQLTPSSSPLLPYALLPSASLSSAPFALLLRALCVKAVASALLVVILSAAKDLLLARSAKALHV